MTRIALSTVSISYSRYFFLYISHHKNACILRIYIILRTLHAYYEHIDTDWKSIDSFFTRLALRQRAHLQLERVRFEQP